MQQETENAPFENRVRVGKVAENRRKESLYVEIKGLVVGIPRAKQALEEAIVTLTLSLYVELKGFGGGGGGGGGGNTKSQRSTERSHCYLLLSLTPG